MSRIHPYAIVAALSLAVVTAAAAAEDLQEVTVTATRVVTTKPVGRSVSGVPILGLSLSYRVSLAGLDLSTSSGADEAAKRVSKGATAACREIGRQYRNSTPSDKECAKEASDKAMVRLHEMVAEAEKARK
jgi:UrcA family protein